MNSEESIGEITSHNFSEADNGIKKDKVKIEKKESHTINSMKIIFMNKLKE
mgnify:CR=1 FL=1